VIAGSSYPARLCLEQPVCCKDQRFCGFDCLKEWSEIRIAFSIAYTLLSTLSLGAGVRLKSEEFRQEKEAPRPFLACARAYTRAIPVIDLESRRPGVPGRSVVLPFASFSPQA